MECGEAGTIPHPAGPEIPHDPEIPLSGVSPREMQTCLPQILYMAVHCSIIHTSQVVGTIQGATTCWMTKQEVVHLYDGILLSIKYNGTWFSIKIHWDMFQYNQEWSIDACYNKDKLSRLYPKWQELDTEGHILHDSVGTKGRSSTLSHLRVENNQGPEDWKKLWPPSPAVAQEEFRFRGPAPGRELTP